MFQHVEEYEAFKKRIGKLSFFDLETIEIEADCITGGFFPSSHEKLMWACRKYPYLHVISMKDRYLYNRPSTGHCMHFLADGERDPSLEFYIRQHTREEYQQILKELVDMPLGERDEYYNFVLRYFSAMAAGADHRNPKIISAMMKDRSPSIRNFKTGT